MTTTMRLEAVSPQYLEAKCDVAAARKALKAAESVAPYMESRNAEHLEEIAEKSRTGTAPNNRLMTNASALYRGTGSGFEIIHRSKCECDGTAECLCDPRTPPYSAAEIADAATAATAAELFLADAVQILAETDPTLDAFANARSVNALYVHWPQSRNRDPRTHNYQGEPVSDEQMAQMGPHTLNRHVQAGSIIAVPS